MQFFKDKPYMVAIPFAVLMVGGFVAFIDHQNDKIISAEFFRACIQGHERDVQHRRECNKAAQGWPDRNSYTFYDKTLVWDEEARMYIVKGNE